MPEIGSCTDITCDNEIKELYECHCCLRLVCLYHLNEHVEITKQNKQQLDDLRNELNTVINTLQLIVEEKFLTIEREQNLIEQAKTFLDISSTSIDDLQRVFEQINQTIASNRSDVADESEISKNNEYSTDINHDFIDIVSFDETTQSIEDQHVNEEEEERKRTSYRKIFGECPLTFNGAYGLTKANHSIKFCEHRKYNRIELYGHFISKHELKEVYAKRLIRAVADNQDPWITKLFDENENVIDHFYKVSCPLFNEQINSLRSTRQNVVTVPCRCRLIPLKSLKRHLLLNHKVSNPLAQKLVDAFKEQRT
ncbi:unnamed protein product [Rotaria sp. Silwood2]|nr:unnamed protein product [Rotaria sp. Silwood2]CAF4146616.1 unnamed protein product [Rotaria sp. Silwood2]